MDPVSNKIIEKHSERRKIDENTDAICKDKKATFNVQILTESAEKSNLVTVEDSKNYSTQSLNKTDQKVSKKIVFLCFIGIDSSSSSTVHYVNRTTQK